MIVKMIILRLLGSSDDKENIGVARLEGPPLRWFRPETSSVQRTRIEKTVKKSKSKKSRQRYFSSTGRTDAIGIGASDGLSDDPTAWQLAQVCAALNIK